MPESSLHLYRILGRVVTLIGLASGRLRSVWFRIRGASLGAKSSIGSRLQISRPWRFFTGQRCDVESDVSIKIVNDEAALILGEYCYVARFAQFDVASRCVIGSHVLIATGCLIVDHNHGISGGRRIDQQPCHGGPINICDDVWLGAYSVVLSGVTIGAGAVVGAHACVTKNVPPGAIVVGVPARIIGYRPD